MVILGIILLVLGAEGYTIDEVGDSIYHRVREYWAFFI